MNRNPNTLTTSVCIAGAGRQAEQYHAHPETGSSEGWDGEGGEGRDKIPGPTIMHTHTNLCTVTAGAVHSYAQTPTARQRLEGNNGMCLPM